VKGIGPKTAVRILEEYETIENLYNKISSVDSTSSPQVDSLLIREKLITNKDQVMLSRRLATMRHDVNVGSGSLEELSHDRDFKKLASDYLMQFGFKSLVTRMTAAHGEPRLRRGEEIGKNDKKKAQQGKLL
jgi:DNA polymerase-1